VRIKFIPSLAFIITRQRSTTKKPINPPGKNWAQGFVRRHPALKSRRVRAIDWKRHENNIYDKIIHWFNVIEKVLRDPAIRPENVYNMDETGVMLCMLGSVKVLKFYQDSLWPCTMYEFRVDFSNLEVFEVLVEGFNCQNYDIKVGACLIYS